MYSATSGETSTEFTHELINLLEFNGHQVTKLDTHLKRDNFQTVFAEKTDVIIVIMTNFTFQFDNFTNSYRNLYNEFKDHNLVIPIYLKDVDLSKVPRDLIKVNALTIDPHHQQKDIERLQERVISMISTYNELEYLNRERKKEVSDTIRASVGTFTNNAEDSLDKRENF